MPRRRSAAALAVAGVAAALVVVPAAPTYAAPVARDDTYSVLAGGTYTISPTDNDSVTFGSELFYGPKSFCGIRSHDPAKVYLETEGDQVRIEVSEAVSGPTEITYALCQGDRTPDVGTITLRVVRLGDVRAVKVATAKGRVRFTNPNGATLQVAYGSASTGRRDAVTAVSPRASTTVSTTRSSIYWVAFYDHDGTIVTAGDGVLTGLQKKTRKK